MLSVLGPNTLKFNRFLLTPTQTRIKIVCRFVSNVQNKNDPYCESVSVNDLHVNKPLITQRAVLPI